MGRLVQTTGLRTKKYKSRRAYLRHRRWARERSLSGLKQARTKGVVEDEDSEWVMAARAKTQEAKSQKAKQTSRQQRGRRKL
jgi:hypothetical protein